jgi:transposase
MATPSTEQVREPEWAALAAIDWADRKHFWRLAPAGSDKQEQGEIENTPEAVDVWAMALHQRFGGRPIAVCLEQSRGSVVCLLAKYPHLVLFAVHPKTAADYRKTFCPSGAKNDAADTASLLDLLERHRDKLRRLEPDTVETRLLQILVETRRQLVNEVTRAKNRLRACLKIYFPQIPAWFDELDSPLVGELLKRWGTLMELRRAHPGTLRQFFHQQNCRIEKLIQERIDGIYQAMPATEDPAIVEGESRKALVLVQVIELLRGQIKDYDRRIAELVATHPEGSLFASLPGAGPVLVPRLIVAFGTRRERFASAEEVECLSGIAPVTGRSGNSSWVHMRRAYPKFLRQTFHEYAGHSIQKSEWARVFYQTHCQNPKQHHATVRALAFKWIRILYRCWKDGRPYNEQIHLGDMHRRNSPLMAPFLLNTDLEWNLEAGFNKLSQKKS